MRRIIGAIVLALPILVFVLTSMEAVAHEAVA
jgi:hypothetical protein